jgi:hypothetical protein
MEKQRWTAPELIVLVRHQPEEAVLEACKDYEPPWQGPTTLNQACFTRSIDACATCALMSAT